MNTSRYTDAAVSTFGSRSYFPIQNNLNTYIASITDNLATKWQQVF